MRYLAYKLLRAGLIIGEIGLRPPQLALDEVRPLQWTDTLTTELLELLRVTEHTLSMESDLLAVAKAERMIDARGTRLARRIAE